MPASELIVNVLFYVFALAALAGAAAVALSRNIVRSAFALLAVLFSTAAMYAFMRADFIVVAQIIIYVGGILVLIIFAVMLTHKITDVKLSNESAPGAAAVFAAVAVLCTLVISVGMHRWERAVPERPAQVPAAPGAPATAARLRMWQGDGRTGVPVGDAVLDGFVRLEAVLAGGRTPRTKVQFLVEERQAPKGDAKAAPTWKEAGRKDVRLEAAPSGELLARADFERLPPASYRWSFRVETPDGFTPWIPYSAPGSGAADFRAERGLTRAIGLAFMGPYLLPFEVVSVLLLAALVGAAFLARKEVKE